MGSTTKKYTINTPILNFYKGKTVFITGVTGFLGTVILEKLLFSTKVKRVYTLIKPKNGRSGQERLKDVFKKECFSRIKESQPDVLNKVVAIEGDIIEKNLGLSEEDRAMLQIEVTVIIHSAANVNFRDALAAHLNVNTLAARHLLQFASTLTRLQAIVYVSTAYSYTFENNGIVDEKIYDLPISTESALYAVESKNPLVEHMADRWVNGYAFSKALAEKIIDTEFCHLPISIVRPTIIVCSVKEPCPGWIESWNGPSPVLNMAGRFLRVWRGNPDSVLDAVPVDYTSHCVLAAAWDCLKRSVNGKSGVKVFNFCSGLRNPLILGDLLRWSASCNNNIHYGKNILSFCLCTAHTIWLPVLFFFLQTLPAYAAEALCYFVGKKSRFMKLHKTIVKMLNTVSWFGLNQFILIDRNVKQLFDSMDEEDRTLFPFDVKAFEWKHLIQYYTFGLKKFVYKQ